MDPFFLWRDLRLYLVFCFVAVLLLILYVVLLRDGFLLVSVVNSPNLFLVLL